MKAQRPRFEVAIAGDRRLAEEVILEVQALAQRYGLEVPSATITSRTAAKPKKRGRRRAAKRGA